MLLPDRREKMAEFGVEMSDDQLLDMDDKTFVEVYLTKKQEFLDEKQRKLDEAAKKIEDDRIATENAKIRDAELKAAKEKQDLIDDENKRIAKEKEDSEKLERSRKYQKFLVENGCDKENSHLFITKTDGNKTTLYKFVGEYIA